MRGWAVRPQERQAGSFGVGASGGADYRDGAVGRRVQLAAEGTDPRGPPSQPRRNPRRSASRQTRPPGPSCGGSSRR
jgi:hypothetical protein